MTTPKIIILKGLPGSGKSTFAKNFITENPGTSKRVNKDDLRLMLDNGRLSKGNENFVLRLRDFVIWEGLKIDKTVVVDDTNFDPRHEKRIRTLAEKFELETGKKVEIEIILIDTPLDICISRDAERAKPVGEKAIRGMYNLWLRPSKIEKAEENALNDPIV